MISGQIIYEDYQIIEKIGQGSFGYVYKIRHRVTHQYYALKTDQKSTTKQDLENEGFVLESIKQIDSEKQQNSKIQRNNNQSIIGHICECIKFIPSHSNSNMMIMPLYGQNLYDLFELCHKRFDSNTIYQMTLAMLASIQYIHNLGFLHRDIKLQNYVIGNVLQQNGQYSINDNIYLIDFGLGKRYYKNIHNKKRNKNKNQQGQIQYDHIDYEIGRKVRGTPMYMSINILLGIQPSRRDDLESFMYIVILLMKGRLPWKSIKINKKDFTELLKLKLSLQPQQLFSQLPKQLLDIYIYIRNLKFQEKPDYHKIYQALESILLYKRNNVQEQYNGQYRKYCWEIYQKKEQSNKYYQKQKQKTSG